MERHRRMDVFLENVEKERVAMHLTQKQMAQKLDMSLSGYKKMIAGETAKVDLQLAYRMYDLTGKYLCELFGDTTPEISMIRKIKKLSPNQQKFVLDVSPIIFQYILQKTYYKAFCQIYLYKNFLMNLPSFL